MAYNVQDEAFVRTHIDFNKNLYEPKKVVTQPVNLQNKDTFEKSTKGENPQKTVETPNNITPSPSFKSKWLTKENLIVGGTGLALTATAIAVGVVSRRGLSRTLSTAQDALSAAQKSLSSAQSDLVENQKIIDALREKVSKLTELPEDLQQAKAVMVKKYNDVLSGSTLSYDPLTPPSQDLVEPNIALKYAKKVLKFDELSSFDESRAVGEILETVKLKEKFGKDGVIELTLPTTSKVKPVISKNASIEGQNIPDLGKTVNSDFKLNYGKRISWSEEKIARDIMQNFYDGHGNTLDGVKIGLKKLPDGQYSVKISGKAVFDYDNLQYMGSGNKLENPYNAGGFGEGAKVLVATMLGKGDTSAVKYASSDWELTFDAASGIIRRTLKKAQTPLEGNTIEFTTSNKKLADAILDSVNYFEHSKNPDFKGLHFESKDFGFKFLDEADKKGNIYLTQRFEFEKAGKWEDGVDDLTLIFNRKPDPVKFKEITGVVMPKDRDRQFMTFADILNYTKYFAREMSDEDLIKALMTTKPKWEKIPIDSDKSALKSFVEGLISECSEREIAIDFSNSKYLSIQRPPSDAIKDMINSNGYRPCSDIFANIGMPSAESIFRLHSVHKAIAPSADEVKKLRLLEEGMKAIKEDIDVALRLHLKKPIFKFNDNISKKELNSFMYNVPKEIKEIAEKYTEKYKKVSYFPNIELLSDAEFKALKKEIEEFVQEQIKKVSSDEKAKYIYEKLMKDCRYSNNVFDVGATSYYNTYKDFSLISDADVTKPRYLFDRNNELSKDTLGEAIIGKSDSARVYQGHWVDKEYFDGATYNDLLATWLHEICHKSGGDGTAPFTYALTDMLKVLLNPSNIKDRNVKLAALQEIFDGIKTPYKKVA